MGCLQDGRTTMAAVSRFGESYRRSAEVRIVVWRRGKSTDVKSRRKNNIETAKADRIRLPTVGNRTYRCENFPCRLRHVDPRPTRAIGVDPGRCGAAGIFQRYRPGPGSTAGPYGQ